MRKTITDKDQAIVQSIIAILNSIISEKIFLPGKVPNLCCSDMTVFEVQVMSKEKEMIFILKFKIN